jgi:ABC-type phosphate/phosphonate transport system substrate-binding protein
MTRGMLAGRTGILVALLAMLAGFADGQERSGLRIGTSGTLAPSSSKQKEKTAVDALQSFIKEETGLNDQIERAKDWRQLAEKLAKGEVQVGVFQGFEFAWAKHDFPQLQALVVTTTNDTYPYVSVMTRKDNQAADFAGLAAATVAVPASGAPFLRLYLDKECAAQGKDVKSFFGKMSAPENPEDALDAVVDRGAQVAVVEHASVDSYKRRKPGRFNQLKEVAHSQTFPPAVIAYATGDGATNGKTTASTQPGSAFHKSGLDNNTRQRFLNGLLNASKTERGESMLTMFRISGFQEPGADFSKVLEQTRQTYPAPK